MHVKLLPLVKSVNMFLCATWILEADHRALRKMTSLPNIIYPDRQTALCTSQRVSALYQGKPEVDTLCHWVIGPTGRM